MPVDPVTLCDGGRIAAPDETEIVTVACALPARPGAVTRNCAEGRAATGVPEITPVELFIERPAGSAGETVNEGAKAKNDAEYGVVGVIGLPTEPETTCPEGEIVLAPTCKTTDAVATEVPSVPDTT